MKRVVFGGIEELAKENAVYPTRTKPEPGSTVRSIRAQPPLAQVSLHSRTPIDPTNRNRFAAFFHPRGFLRFPRPPSCISFCRRLLSEAEFQRTMGSMAIGKGHEVERRLFCSCWDWMQGCVLHNPRIHSVTCRDGLPGKIVQRSVFKIRDIYLLRSVKRTRRHGRLRISTIRLIQISFNHGMARPETGGSSPNNGHKGRY